MYNSVIYTPKNGQLGSYIPIHPTNPSESIGGEITITDINLETKVVSGRFKCTLYRLSNPMDINSAVETIKIADGRFINISFGEKDSPNSGNGNNGSNNGGNNSASNKLALKVNNTSWTPSTVNGVAVAVSGLLSINGSTPSTQESIMITVPSNVEAGTYDFTDVSASYSFAYLKGLDPNGGYIASSGKLVITSHDKAKKNIKGTFNGVGSLVIGTGTVNITDGSFDITYTAL